MQFLYDGTFTGLLSVVFESYRLKTPATAIIAEADFSGDLFEKPLSCSTDPQRADRVEKALLRKTSEKAVTMLFNAFHSEEPGIEMLIYRFIRMALDKEQNPEDHYTDPTVAELARLNRQIGREVHRMHAFVRFNKGTDGVFYAVIDPDFNVLPLIGDHFQRRYAAMKWVIYDSKRRYGIFYNLEKIDYVVFDANSHLQLQNMPPDRVNEEEAKYQTLWKEYFKSVNIPERKNLKLHLQHVPRRYWKYLTEKF